MALNDKQKRFVVEYCVDFNATQAAIRAGYSSESATSTASLLLTYSHVYDAVQDRIREVASAKAVTAEWVLDQWRQIASADPNDLIYIRVECCRHCYGINFEFQWVESEYNTVLRECREHVCNPKCEIPCGKRVPPLALGGFGFTVHKSPNPDCPKCGGDGFERVIACDTRLVTGPARRLYAGVKKTKDGIEIKMRDQDAALNNIAKYLGMLIDKRELSGPNGQAIPIATNYTARDLTDDQLAQLALEG
jgi:phage terminase small subunit